MKIKLLLIASLSLFCFNGLTKLKSRSPIQQNNKSTGLNTVSYAFKKAQVKLNLNKCVGACARLTEGFPNKVITGLNITANTPQTKHYLNSLIKIVPQLARWRSSTEITSALAKAVVRSTTENWPKKYIRNLMLFIEGLTDGVNEKEAVKVRQIIRDC